MSITVVKIGGNVVDNPQQLMHFLKDFASLPGKKILVHGGGKEATRLSDKLEIPTRMIDGRRVTSKNTLDIVTMVYAGLVNKRIVSMLQAEGCNAIGLSGADADIIRAVRRNPNPVDYGFVGDIHPDGVNSNAIGAILNAELVPVFCAITHDGNATLLNCNADSIASALAIGVSNLDTTTLVYCFELPGVLVNIEDENSVIPILTPQIYADFKSRGAVSKGMIPKIDNAFAAIDAGVDSVVIKKASSLTENEGTQIRK